MNMAPERGIERVASAHNFAATFENLESIVKSKGMLIFAKVDFSGDAQRAGLTMAPTQILIFGNPKGGTPVMVAAPSAALDLPLKVLVSQDAAGKVWLTYNTPEYLAERHAIPAQLTQNLMGIRAVAQAAAT